MTRIGRRWPRLSTSLGVVFLATFLHGQLLLRLGAREAKLALSRLLAGREKKPPREDGWIGRLLLSQLRRIERLQGRMGDRGPLQPWISKRLATCGGALSATARLSLAERFFEAAARPLPRFSELRISYVRTVGILRFMQGKMRDAMPCFAEVAETKRVLRSRRGVPKNVRILADSWFVALGHVAMIDFLLKKQRLGWEEPATVFFSTRAWRTAPGQTVLRELEHLGVLLRWPDDAKTTFDQIVDFQNRAGGGAVALPSALEPRRLRTWDCLETDERAALVEEFWESSFPDGEGLPYAHAAAKIQNRWEAENRPPLFARREEADASRWALRRQLGIPEDAWYACLHVRQGGFHHRWNRLWEQARDADILTYSLAIRAIVERGGHVVRMGDPSMPPLPPLDGAIDYAHSTLKCEYADILLLGGARLFVGTNSGLSVVPGIHGVPCVLTNWVPIGLPNWFGRDLMIPKLLRYRGARDLVTLDEMLGTDLGYVQNPRNLPAGLEFVDNTPEELAAVVSQMLCELAGEADHVRDRALEEAYFAEAARQGSYRGSRIGTAFMRDHRKALGLSWKNEEASELHPIT